jgi:6-phosphogluconolactonase
VYLLDPDRACLVPLEAVEVGPLTMPLCASEDGSRLYAATRNEAPSYHGFKIEPSTGKLQPTGAQPAPASMAYVSLAAQGTLLLGASFGEDLLCVSAIGTDGQVQIPPLSTCKTPSRPHFVVSLPGRDAVLVSALGTDQILQYGLDPLSGSLTSAPQRILQLPALSGPRHLAVAPDGEWGVVVNQLSGNLTSFFLTQANGLETVINTVSISRPDADLRPATERPGMTIGAPFRKQGVIAAADVCLSPDGRLAFVTERCGDTVAVVKIDQKGWLGVPDLYTTVDSPRSVSCSPCGRFLAVLGENAAHLDLFRIDEHGALLRCDTPAFAPGGASCIFIQPSHPTDI